MRTAFLSSLTLAVLGSCSAQVDRAGVPEEGTARDPTTVAEVGNTVAQRFTPPAGFDRVGAISGSFAAYLRDIRLKPTGEPVHLYNGELKRTQNVHAAVVDLSVGKRDLQQCADAVMRLHAEHLYSSGSQDEIAFDFTNGFKAEWKRWRQGERIRVSGNTCTWTSGEKPDASHDQLLRYLETVFTYAGSLSLQHELDRSTPVDLSATDLRAGDVFIRGGSPGHAMIVMDVARHRNGHTAFLLAQSYMPAQEIHLVKNVRHPEMGAWFIRDGDDRLYTPEWTFDWGDRRRWPD